MVAAVAKYEEEEREMMISTTGEFAHQSIMAVAIVLRPPCGPTPGFYAYNNQ
jgi:hypothetical protein